MKNKEKISVKDLITIAIFSVIFFVLIRLAAMIGVLLPVLFPFCSAIGLLLCGTVWVCLLAKVPKKFCVCILCIIISLLSFITGTLWTIALGLFIGGVAAESIGRLGKAHNVIVSVAAYAAFGLFLHFGIIVIIFFFNDYWRRYVSKIGVNETYIDTISKTISWPLFGLSCAAVVLCAALGIMLGRFILKKHFIKAGLV